MPIINLKAITNQITNQPPGTLRYTGKLKTEKVTVEVIEYCEESISRKIIKSVDELPESSPNVVWLNVIGMHDTSLVKKIGEHFGIHRIDLEGVVNVVERSKIENKDEYLFSILKMVYIEENRVMHEHLSVILKNNVLITFQETKGDVFDAVRERLDNKEGQIRSLGADYLYYSLLDNVIDQYYDIISYVSDRFTEAETAVIAENKNEMAKVYWLRKELLYLKNGIDPLHSAIRGLIQNKPELLGVEIFPYLRDVLDNVSQIMEEIMTFREMVNSLFETQMSNSSNDMNKTMMTLTIFSAIFIPLSFLAGVFGMNFISVPGLTSQSSFIIFCAGCAIIAVGMLVFFKIRKWF